MGGGRSGASRCRFDRVLVVDWSASSRPKRGRDSIWVCSSAASDPADDRVENPPTRAEARRLLRSLLVAAVARRERVLVGVDVAYGYPEGFARALDLPGIPWRATWDHLRRAVHDDERNGNDRFAVAADLNARLPHHAFWGHPSRGGLPHLSPRKDRVRYDAGLGEWRATEQALRDRGRHPHPVWKLTGAGAVGSQALVGIPVLAALRDDPLLAPCSRVWPFEVHVPDLPPGRPTIVHAEVWPSLVEVTPRPGAVRDRLQVEALAHHLLRLDGAGGLADLFAAAPPGVLEEGWILGA